MTEEFYRDLIRLKEEEQREEEIMEQRERKKIEEELAESNGEEYIDIAENDYMIEGSSIIENLLTMAQLLVEYQDKLNNKKEDMTYVQGKRIENKENEVIGLLYELGEEIEPTI